MRLNEVSRGTFTCDLKLAVFASMFGTAQARGLEYVDKTEDDAGLTNLLGIAKQIR